MPSLKERAKTLIDLIDGAHFLFADRPIPLDDKARGVLSPEARGLLRDLEGELGAVEPWSTEATEQCRAHIRRAPRSQARSVAQPLRAALTGRTTSPGIFEVLAVLGKGESLARVADQANKVRTATTPRRVAARWRHARSSSARWLARRRCQSYILQCTLGCARPMRPEQTTPPTPASRPIGPAARSYGRQISRMRSWTRKPAPTSRPAS